MASRYYFSTRDLVLIAVISSLGGVLSTYVGYLGNMLNNLFGVPFGAGQFMAGLHIFWVMLVYGLTKKKGTAIMAGLLKGFVEFLSGGKLGILAVALTVFQAAIIEVAFLFMENPKTKMYALVGGLSTAANILFFQLVFATYDAWPLFLALSTVAFISGVIFAGLFALSVVELVQEDKPLNKSSLNIKKVVTLGLIFSLAFGALYYQFGTPDGDYLKIGGNVENEISVYYYDYEDDFITINTEMVGKYQYEPPKDYEGIPLSLLLEEAGPKGDKVTAIASDAYTVEFDLDMLLGIENAIITLDENEEFRMIVPGREAGEWVRMLVELRID